MYRLSDVIGKSIVSADTGDRLGSVSDALFEDGGRSVVALVVGGGLIAKEHLLPFAEVQALGADVVLARTNSGILGPEEWRERGVVTTRLTGLQEKPVVTAGGHQLGSVSDLFVNEQTGTLDGLEVSAPAMAGLRTKRSILPASDQMRLGSDVVVVPDSAADHEP
ncbi:MAG TPA: PRC-barrel domain-containing protein [Vicinamibacterales bacterium]|nr:PRC-barrel domain-containing protein [Vicinamibacterales bacterium]